MKILYENISIAVDSETDSHGQEIFRAFAYDSDGMNIAIAKCTRESGAIGALFSTMRDDAQEVAKREIPVCDTAH